MNQQPPELPPMKPVQISPSQSDTADRLGPAQRQPGPSGTPVGRRLRQMVSVIAGGGFALTVGVGALEMIAKPEFRPTTLLSTIEGRTHLGTINQTMGMKPGDLPLTEADYRAKLAEAERGGQAKAELTFQRQLAHVQADKEQVVQAYGALYQRTNQIAQAGLQMELQAQQFRQQLLAMTNGGRAAVLAVEDTVCALGSEEACEAARKLRAGMIDESSTLSEGDMAQKINKLMAGIPDPASFVVREDQRRKRVPSLADR